MKLIVEVLDHAPANLTAVDRLLLVAIAEDANDKTRQGYPGWELVARRMGWSGHKDGGKNAVSTALAALAGRGLDVRVPLTTDKNGRPVYAVRGRRATYRIPPLERVAPTATQTPERVEESATHDGWQPVPPIEEKGWQIRGGKGGNSGGERVAATATPPLTIPSLSPHTPPATPVEKKPPAGRQTALIPKTAIRLPQATQIVLDGLHTAGYPNATPDDATAVHRAVCQRYPGKVNLGWLRTMASNRSYGPFYEDVRTARSEQVEATIRELQHTEPPCEHDTPAGRAPHPTTGLLMCPLCREGIPAVPDTRERTHPAVVAALDAYRNNTTGPLSAITLMRITQEATALHNRHIPAEILTQLAAKAAQTNTGLLAAATAQ